ncbi:MAG TPA: HAMP domain-containing sensor histidine kinase [Euzebyales bacterium]|nr:HAMP domain-containing sensor histidine kinase [Euzebyales bacterium]
MASVIIARSVSRPLRRLQHTASTLADGQLSARADVDAGPPEVRAVASTFNTMAARLEQLLASQQAFVADASHQLRTPLTALRLRLENLEPAVTDDAAADLAAAIDKTTRLGRLVEGLLTLARTDGARAETVAIDAAEALRTRYDVWRRPVTDDRDLTLRLDLTAVPPVAAATGVIDQALDNLIANAIDAAPAGSTITLAARRADDMVELHVADQGPGMTDTQRRRAFDRFWRAGATDHNGSDSACPSSNASSPPPEEPSTYATHPVADSTPSSAFPRRGRTRGPTTIPQPRRPQEAKVSTPA